MIGLADYLAFWGDVVTDFGRVGILPVTVDEAMGRTIQNLPRGSVTLFVLPPVATFAGGYDSRREECECVVFLMKRYDPQRATAWDVLTQTQPVIEAIKTRLIDKCGLPCAAAGLLPATLNTIAETKFYAGFAYWSLGFKLRTG